MEHHRHLPGWNLDDPLHLSTNRRSIRPEDELVELLWRDGQVVLHSQTQRRQHQQQEQQPLQTLKQDQETLITSNNNNTTPNFLEDQETVSWIQYPPDSDPFETDDFSSRFFSSMDPITPSETPKHDPQPQLQVQAQTQAQAKVQAQAQAMEPPKFKFTDSSQGKEQYSVNSVGSSHDLSNQSRNDLDLVNTNTTSSSGGSSGCIIDRKRKHTVSQSDVRSKGSTRRSRAAEVHNLSERRRRDRINERMKALQELIPHCSKTDKASILDEAIDYLKSLQLQIQMMWMGSGMTAAPMMFPGVQTQHQFPMGLQIQSPVQLPQFPVLDRSHPGLVCQNPVYFPQMQAVQPMETLRIGSPAGRKSQQTSVPTTTTDGPP